MFGSELRIKSTPVDTNIVTGLKIYMLISIGANNVLRESTGSNRIEFLEAMPQPPTDRGCTYTLDNIYHHKLCTAVCVSLRLGREVGRNFATLGGMVNSAIGFIADLRSIQLEQYLSKCSRGLRRCDAPHDIRVLVTERASLVVGVSDPCYVGV